MFAEMFGVELAAAVEASTGKEDKKAEKTSLKEEAIKEVHKDIEIKVDEREKPKVPVFLFDFSSGSPRPTPLSKPDLDLLPKPIMPPIFKEVINNENRKEAKPKVEEEKKARPEELKKEVCSPKPTGQSVEGTNQSKRNKEFKISNRKSRREARGKPSVHNYPIGYWQEQASLGTSGKSNASAEHEGSVNNAQENPKSKLTDVFEERAARGNGNTPSRS